MQSGENERTVRRLIKRLLTIGGITDTIAGWSKRTKVPRTTIAARLNSGCDEEMAVQHSLKKYKESIVRELWHGRWVYTANQM